jgi:class 3 adenylate cyclase
MLKYLHKIGVNENDSHEVKLRKYTLILITSCCFVAAPVWGFSYYLLGLETSSFVPLAYMILLAPAMIHFAVTKKENVLLNTQIIGIFLCPVVMQWLAGGLFKGGVIILWSFLAPLTALIFYDIKKARVWMALVLLATIATVAFNDYFEGFGDYLDKSQRIYLLGMNLIGATLVVYFSIQYFVKTIKKNNVLLQHEKKKSDDLLLNILPAQVADELKRTGKIAPTLYSDTTIIFSDFKDFTQYSELFTPEELINELDRCFKKFDEIITNHGLEKIKTIGDAYMCVAGIPRDQRAAALNACRAVRAAIDMVAFIEETRAAKLKEGKAFWDIRIGIHTGDVVAGIVGQKKFAFDIWGDAVNIANRLETCSEEGKINISGTTFKLIQNYFNCSYRGKLPVKNKGQLEMYFVDSKIELLEEVGNVYV